MDEQNRLDRIEGKLDALTEKQKVKKFGLPFKARVGKAKLKKGYATVQIINENKEIDFKKFPITDGTIKVESSGDNTFHAVAENDIFTYKGKPFIIQPKGKLNPYNPVEGKNETYGQKYVMARMKADVITAGRKFGWGISIFGIIIAGIIIYAFLTGG